MDGLMINALCAGYGKRRIIGHPSILMLPFARRAEKVVFLPQSLPQGVHLQVLESMVITRRAFDAGQNQAQTIALLEELGIAHLAINYLDSLSGGQKQLMGPAQPPIRRSVSLLLDEPLNALDLNYQFHMMDVVSHETRRHNMVTLVVLHDISVTLRHAAQAIMLKEGKLIDSGDS